MKKINLESTNRGFLRGEFIDVFGEECSIQESSLADENAIWLGANSKRMHLTQKHVKVLLPLLKNFVKNGDLSEKEKRKSKSSDNRKLEGCGEIKNARKQKNCAKPA
jgi:hypothetical protein